MTAVTTQSELESINTLLDAIHEAPVNTLNPPFTGDVSRAMRTLSEVSSAIQGKGFHWNTENEYELTPDQDGFINCPLNTLKCDIDPNIGDRRDVTLRGTRLYNKSDRTYVFDDTVTCELVLLLPFDELPEMARRYITMRAARIFVQRSLGGDLRPVAQDEQDALVSLMDHEHNTADLSLLDSPSIARYVRR